MCRLPIAVAFALTFASVHPSPAIAQNSSTLSPLLSSLGARLASGQVLPDAPSIPATRFKSTGRRTMLEAFVTAASEDAGQRENLRTLLRAVFTAYEAAAEKGGISNDLAGALAFYVGANYTAYTGGAEIDEAGSALVARQIRAALETPVMRAASDSEKQQLYENFIMMAGLLSARQELAKGDPAATKALRALGAEGLKYLLGVDASRVKITGEGLRITPAGGAITPPKGRPLKTLLFSASSRWVRKDHDDGLTLSVRKEEYLSSDAMINIVLTEPLPFAGSLQQSFRKYWKEKVLTLMKGEDRPQVLLTMIGGRRCAFAERSMDSIQTGVSWNTRYLLIDGGDALYPAFILKSHNFSDSPGSGKGVAEQVIATFRVPAGAPPAKPLATKADLSRNWSASASSVTNYVNAYTGANAGTSILAYSQTYTFKPNGTYTGNFGGINNGARMKSAEKGTYKLQGDLLVLTESSGRVTKKRFLGIDTPPGAATPLMVLLNPQYPLTAANIGLYGEKYGVKN